MPEVRFTAARPAHSAAGAHSHINLCVTLSVCRSALPTSQPGIPIQGYDLGRYILTACLHGRQIIAEKHKALCQGAGAETQGHLHLSTCCRPHPHLVQHWSSQSQSSLSCKPSQRSTKQQLLMEAKTHTECKQVRPRGEDCRAANATVKERSLALRHKPQYHHTPATTPLQQVPQAPLPSCCS